MLLCGGGAAEGEEGFNVILNYFYLSYFNIINIIGQFLGFPFMKNGISPLTLTLNYNKIYQ